jgi:hypothetical protein
MTNEKQSSSRSLLWLIMVLPVVLVVARGALADSSATRFTAKEVRVVDLTHAAG